MKQPGVLDIPSMKNQCSEAEWQARVDLAACYRLVDHYGLSDMMANHISSHVPGEPGAFLINPYRGTCSRRRGTTTSRGRGGRSALWSGRHCCASSTGWTRVTATDALWRSRPEELA